MVTCSLSYINIVMVSLSDQHNSVNDDKGDKSQIDNIHK